ncbi:MAG: tetratricopeptide repeat protein [Chloroflexi bacterium]|nr:tetratricopeptide repeat protein [Chloroflexota bacterium]MCI0580794.1 tetratricopeptide repeat protein [Chloroflexota bacterium]MCI0647299.1 tetratricopeptide repeat protein [Chloroflexota bacterium]MCI0726945.1 tetratricopeptide repeat protein [Chloroflexota bacterium]
MNSLISHLTSLESADLIRLAQSRPELAYIFRHALVQEAVYRLLLVEDRRRLHLAVAETLERLYTGRLDAAGLAPTLGLHFDGAGDDERAQKYYMLAGDLAMSQYANVEAISHYSRALEIARRCGNQEAVIKICQARGLVYEISGDFERARHDHETALKLARTIGNRRGEWQALLDLGKLWAAHDYTRTGEYFQQALELARQLDDPSTLARSLNRLGNWHVNLERPEEGQRYHEEALAIFESLNDRRGMATTLDLLGLALYEIGDIDQGTARLQRAVALFRELDDPQGLSSSLAMMAFRGAIPLIMLQLTLPLAAREMAGATADAEAALKLAQEIGWRAGEAFALFQLALGSLGLGEYTRALAQAQRALTIAQGIGHQQWTTGSYHALGSFYLDVLAFSTAQQYLEQALLLAREIHSLIWTNQCSSLLALANVYEGNLARAEAVLKPLLDPATGTATEPRTIGQRMIWFTRAELALSQDKADEALQIMDTILAATPNLALDHVPLSLWWLKARALVALDRPEEAIACLNFVMAQSENRPLPLLWRLYLALGQAYQAQGNGQAAGEAFSKTRAFIQELARQVPEGSLRENFVRQATAMLPTQSPAGD